MSVDAPDTDLWVKILDVHPDGTAYNVMSAGLDVVRASYRNRRAERELLQPGAVYRLDFTTLMTGNRFLKGHRVRVALMASFAPNMSWNLHTGALEFDSAATATATDHGARRRRAPVANRPAGRCRTLTTVGLARVIRTFPRFPSPESGRLLLAERPHQQERRGDGGDDEDEAGGNPEQRADRPWAEILAQKRKDRRTGRSFRL